MTICFACTLILSGCIGPEYGKYVIDFSRNYSNYDERRAIEVAENINYTNYVNISRFYDEWANFIDSETINHYNSSFFEAKENKDEIDIYYTYIANAKFYTKLNITIGTENWNINISINGIYYFNIDHDTAIIALIDGMDSNIIKWQEEYPQEEEFFFNQNFEQIYLIDMQLSYDATWGPLAAYYVNTFQIILLDKDYNFKMIILSPSAHIVS